MDPPSHTPGGEGAKFENEGEKPSGVRRKPSTFLPPRSSGASRPAEEASGRIHPPPPPRRTNEASSDGDRRTARVFEAFRKGRGAVLLLGPRDAGKTRFLERLAREANVPTHLLAAPLDEARRDELEDLPQASLVLLDRAEHLTPEDAEALVAYLERRGASPPDRAAGLVLAGRNETVRRLNRSTAGRRLRSRIGEVMQSDSFDEGRRSRAALAKFAEAVASYLAARTGHPRFAERLRTTVRTLGGSAAFCFLAVMLTALFAYALQAGVRIRGVEPAQTAESRTPQVRAPQVRAPQVRAPQKAPGGAVEYARAADVSAARLVRYLDPARILRAESPFFVASLPVESFPGGLPGASSGLPAAPEPSSANARSAAQPPRVTAQPPGVTAQPPREEPEPRSSRPSETSLGGTPPSEPNRGESFEALRASLLALRNIAPDETERARALVSEAGRLRAAGLLTEAEAKLRAAIEAEPTSPVAHNNLADLLLARREYEAARTHALLALALGPPDAGPVLDTLGWAYAGLGRDAEALDFLSRSLQHGRTWLRLYHRGSVYLRLGDVPRGRADLLAAYDLAPDTTAREVVEEVLVRWNVSGDAEADTDA